MQRRLSALLSIRQLEALHAANLHGSAAEKPLRAAWNKILVLLRRKPKPGALPQFLSYRTLHAEVRAILDVAYGRTAQQLQRDLGGMAAWGHVSAADALKRTLPMGVLNGGVSGVNIDFPGRVSSGSYYNRDYSLGIGTILREDDTRASPRPGLVTFTRNPYAGNPAGYLGYSSLLAHGAALDPPVLDRMTKAEQRDYFAAILFKPPTEAEVQAILRTPVNGQSWQQEMGQATRLASPETVASGIAQAFAAGQNWREIAKTIRPSLQGVQSSARRVARTFGMQVAHEMQMRSHAQLGDMVIGYQIHALLDQHTRSWHAARSGTIYYAKPGIGQKGYYQMPNPPREAADPRERPPGEPSLAMH